MGSAGDSSSRLDSRWSDLPREHRRWVVYNAILITGLINLLMNAGILFVTTAVRREIRVGRLAPLGNTPWTQPLLARLPIGRLRRGAALGGLCAVVLSPLCALVLVGVDTGGMSMTGFVLYKAMFGLVLGSIVTPVIALCAMADTVGSVNQGTHPVQLGVRS